jgi:tetratricopeptide (TPR) repeat protein
MNPVWMVVIIVSSALSLRAAPSTECEAALAWAVEGARLGPSDASKTRFAELLATFEHTPGNALCLGIAASNAAAIAQRQGDVRDAERFASRAVTTLETLGPRDPSLGRPLQLLAGAYIAQGQFDKARKFLARIESIGPLAPVDAALLAGARATMLEREGRLHEAERQYQEAMSRWEKASPGVALDIVPEMENLALLYMKQERSKEAESLLRSALSIVDTVAEPAAGLRVAVLTNLGIFRVRQHDWSGAQASLARAMAIALQSEVQPDVRRRLYEAYAVVLRKAGRKREARKIVDQARGIVMSQSSSQVVSFRELRRPQSR